MIAAVAKTQKERDRAVEILNSREKLKKQKEALENLEQPHHSGFVLPTDSNEKITADEEIVKFRKIDHGKIATDSLIDDSEEQEIKSKSWGYYFLNFLFNFI